MSNRISYEEQIEMGLVPKPKSNFVAPLRGDVLPPALKVEPIEPINLPSLPAALYASKAIQDDNAITQAQATLLVSKAYIAASLLITVALMFIVYLARGGESYNYFFGGMLLWGLSIFAILHANRAQGLHHSATGLGHHEIDSRERIALHAIDRHADIIEARYKSQGGSSQ